MFRRLPDLAGANGPAPVTVTLDGDTVRCFSGDTVAVALLLSGCPACRSTPVSGAARGPFCLMGVCYDCLVTIDGVPNQQACVTPVRQGMVIAWQDGPREVGSC